MSVFQMYIGDLDDPDFVWDPDDETYQIGNAPRAIGQNLPFSRGLGYMAFNLINKIGAGEYEGRQVDWGCWVARVTRAQIVDFIHEYYVWWQLYDRHDDADSFDECAEILKCVINLDPGKYYGLVAFEFYSVSAISREPLGSRHLKDITQEACKHRRPA